MHKLIGNNIIFTENVMGHFRICPLCVLLEKLQHFIFISSENGRP